MCTTSAVSSCHVRLGSQEVLHVHVPHYTHMFESIMAGPRPWRFGHVYLPGGSASLGTPAAAIQSCSTSTESTDSDATSNGTSDLEAGSAPSVGSLMELVSALRCTDGRLLILAYSVGRIQVVFPSDSCIHAASMITLCFMKCASASNGSCGYAWHCKNQVF